MERTKELKKIVADKYSEIVKSGDSCCGSVCGSTKEYNFVGDAYQAVPGYQPEADLGLGCGLPTEYALIKEGDVVVDLGSGAGNDCFVARSLTGPNGMVIGVDFTPAMIRKAEENAAQLGYSNVHFVEGDIEKIPLSGETADVVVSNCVMNLVPDKELAFVETFRILRPGGHFSISDIVTKGQLPDKLKQSAEMYAGCVAGAIDLQEYLSLIKNAGFTNVSVQKEKVINLPKAILESFLEPEHIDDIRNHKVGIYSVTVYGEKPQQDCCEDNCCK